MSKTGIYVEENVREPPKSPCHHPRDVPEALPWIAAARLALGDFRHETWRASVVEGPGDDKVLVVVDCNDPAADAGRENLGLAGFTHAASGVFVVGLLGSAVWRPHWFFGVRVWALVHENLSPWPFLEEI